MPKNDKIDGMVKQFKKDAVAESDDDDFEGGSSRPKSPLVDHPAFNLAIGLVICANAITIGLETDARAAGDSSNGLWYVLEVFFCLTFFVELMLRLWYNGTSYFTHPRDQAWNILDFFIVMTSCIDTFMLMPIGMGGGMARFASMLRFVRLLRLVRLIRLFRLFKELWLVASGLLQSLRTLLWVCVVMFLIIEFCAIITTRAIGHNDEEFDPYFKASGGWDHEKYFKTIGKSIFTLVQIMTFDSWSEDIVRHVVAVKPAFYVFFIAFIMCCSFGFLNIIVGVVVENIVTTAQKDQNKVKGGRDRDRQMVFNQLREIFEVADVDGSGTLTLEEVLNAVNKPEVYNKLKMIDFPVEDPQQIFLLLDYDDSGELTIEEFITGCIRMKGQAKSKDLLGAQVAVDTMRKHCETFEYELERFNAKLKLLDQTARAVVGQGEHVFLDMREYRMRHPEVKESTIPRMPTADLVKAPWENGINRADVELNPLKAIDYEKAQDIMMGFVPGDSFEFTVYDKDDGKYDDLLGRITLPSKRFYPGGFEGELQLKDAGNGPPAFLKIRIFPFKDQGSKITIVSARDLRDADWMPGGGESDPYCVCEIPHKPKSRIETHVIPNTGDPVWHFSATIEVDERVESNLKLKDKQTQPATADTSRQPALRDTARQTALRDALGQTALSDAPRQPAIADAEQNQLALAVPGQPMRY